MKEKTVLTNLVLFFFVSLISFFLCEFVIRWKVPIRTKWDYGPHRVLHHVHTPNSLFIEKQPFDEFDSVKVRYNSLGLRRNGELNEVKKKNEFRILLLGDSFIEARQVAYENTLAQILERKLNDYAI